MDGNNWRANSGHQAHVPGQVMGGEAPAAPGMDASDWRTQLPDDSRQRIINQIFDILKRCLPFSGQEGLEELKTIAVRFEEKTYTNATSQSDYSRKISLKMLAMEAKSQTPQDPVNSSATTISANLNSILMFDGSNFKDWKENALIVLGRMDLDLALRVEQPASLTDASSPDGRRNFEKWERSNRMSLMIIKRDIPEAFRGAVSEEVTNAKQFLAKLEKRFAKNDKAETSTLLQSLISMKYRGKGNIREYIMKMSHTASKLKALKLDLSDDLLVHLVLISLPAHFSQFKVSYNCQREKWTLNELISYCVQEEERLKQDKTEIANLESTSKDKGKKRKTEYEAAMGPDQKKPHKDKECCFFCLKPEHLKKDCTKYNA